MSKPHVLVLSPHAGIGEGLVRLLALDGRFDARRAASPSEASGLAPHWRADVVLVDGALLRDANSVLALPAPALILTGQAEDADALLPRVPSARGWLRKDPTYPELERALASVGASSPPLLAGRARLGALAVSAVAISGVAFACAWLLLN